MCIYYSLSLLILKQLCVPLFPYLTGTYSHGPYWPSITIQRFKKLGIMPLESCSIHLQACKRNLMF